MRGNLHKLAFALISVPLLFGSRSIAHSFYFESIDVPCSNCPNGIARRTAIGGINPRGDIVGVYTDAVGTQHGFLLSQRRHRHHRDGFQDAVGGQHGFRPRGGQFETIDVPGALAGVGGTLPTIARGISPSGVIVGQYTAPVNAAVPPDSPAYCPAAGSPACTKGFWYSHGRFETVLFPGHPGAIPGRVTPDGSMYGCFHDFDVMGSMFSATWTRFGVTSLAPNGGELSDSTQSYPNSMHGGATPDGSTIGGFYVDMTGHQHGYIVQNGVLQTYDVPLSTLTTIWDINPRREFVGTYVDQNGKRHGFLQLPNGSAPMTFDVPGMPPFNAVSTIAMGINRRGAIVGQYTDTSGQTHGFLAVPADAR